MGKFETVGRYGPAPKDYAGLNLRVLQLEARIAMYETELHGLRVMYERELRDLKAKLKMLHYESLARQNERGRRRLAEAFGTDPTGSVSANSLDGMMKDFVRPGDDSRDLVRLVRDRH